MDPIEQVRAFAEATDPEEKWSSARRMMSSKAKPNGELFYSLLQRGFARLGQIAESADDSSRLVAIDLLVRLPASMKNNKRVQAMASDVSRIADSVPGRLLIGFPGKYAGGVYRLLDARDGWNYHAIPTRRRPRMGNPACTRSAQASEGTAEADRLC